MTRFMRKDGNATDGRRSPRQGGLLRDRRGRSGHAARPLAPSPVSGRRELAPDADRAQGRGARLRQAGGYFDPARDRRKRACAAAQVRRAASAGRQARQSWRRRSDPRDDSVRGSRRDGAQQALRPRGAGRLGDHAPYRWHAAGARRQGRQPARSRSSAGPRHIGRAADRQIAKDGGGARRDLPLAPGEEDLLGAGRRRAEAGAGAHLDVSRQGRGHGRNARAKAGRTSSACASPSTAIPTRSIR